MDGLAGTILSHWHGHAEVLIGLALLEGLYLLGVGPLRERFNLADDVDPKYIATFTAGVVVVFASLQGPLHILADNYLFSAHMLQHVMITLVAPPLLILGTPDWLFRPLLRPNWTFKTWRVLVNPFVAFFAFNMMFSLWHVPALYNASTSYHLVHVGEHLLFIATAFLVWWPLTSNMPELPRLSYPLQMVYVFGLSVAQIIVFGAVTFSQGVIYEHYVHTAPLVGLPPLIDQQIGGIIMKVGSGLMFLVLFIIAFFRWYREEERNGELENDNRRRLSYIDGPAWEDDTR